MTELRRIIRIRDGITNEDFDDVLRDILCEECDSSGIPLSDPEDILNDYFSIEPDYVFDLFEELANVTP